MDTTPTTTKNQINFFALRDAIDWYRSVGRNAIADKFESMFPVELAAVDKARAEASH